MLKESTMKMMKNEATKELKEKKAKGRNAEIVYIPVLIERDSDGNVGSITSYTGYIMSEENK